MSAVQPERPTSPSIAPGNAAFAPYNVAFAPGNVAFVSLPKLPNLKLILESVFVLQPSHIICAVTTTLHGLLKSISYRGHEGVINKMLSER